LPLGAIGVLAPQLGVAAAIPVLPVVAGVGTLAILGGVLVYRLRQRSKQAH